MSIEFDKNKKHILLVYNDVLDDKSSTDWALFGYEGQTNVIKVVGYGDEGLEELTEELNASKIMYGVLKLLDPNTSRFKIILLNWQGEAAPNLRKGVCARHLHDVKRFFKGFHITFNARTEEDVDQEMIIKAVTKATSTDYNFKDRSEMPDKSIPVGTNYKRTNPVAEIDANRRNKFWEEQEAEEKVRKEEEIRKKEEEAQNLEKERIERELRDSKQREELNKERNARIFAEKKMEMAAMEMMRKRDTVSWEREIVHQRMEEDDRSQRADHMRRERKKEAESVIGQKTHHARSMFESHRSDSPVGAPLASGRSLEETQRGSRPPPRKLKEFSPTNVDQEPSVSSARENTAPKKSVGARWPPPSLEEIAPQTQAKVPPGKISEWAPRTAASFNPSERTSGSESKVIDPTPLVQTAVSTPFHHRTELSETSYQGSKSKSPTISPTLNFSTSPAEVTLPSSPLAQEAPSSYLPQSVSSPIKSLATPITENGDTHGWHPNNVGQERSNLDHSPTNEVTEKVSPSLYSSQEHAPAVTSPELEEIDSYGSVCMTYEVEGIEYQILPEHGICARALYDYQAADDTEITFDPGDIITNIDQIDVGWWQGVSVMGVFGLFPANYVELINGTKIH